MDLTIDQIKEVAEKQPELKNAIISSFTPDFLKTPPADVVIRTKDEDKKYLDSHVSAVVEERVSKESQARVDQEFGKMLTNIDQHVESVTGLKKNPGEKTFDFAKRALEEKQRAGGDPVTKERVRQLEETLNATKTEYEKKLGEANGQLFSREIEWQINADLDKQAIALPVHLKTDEEKQGYTNQQKALIKQGFLGNYTPKRDDKGNIVFYKGDQPQLDAKDGTPLSAGSLIGRDFSAWFVPQGQTQTGTGTGSGQGQGAGVPTGGFKDKEDIHKFLAANGVDAGSKQYMDELQRLAGEAKIKI